MTKAEDKRAKWLKLKKKQSKNARKVGKHLKEYEEYKKIQKQRKKDDEIILYLNGFRRRKHFQGLVNDESINQTENRELKKIYKIKKGENHGKT